MRHVDQRRHGVGVRRGLEVLERRVVAQVGGDVHVGAAARGGLQEGVARPGADGDGAHRALRLAGVEDPARGRGDQGRDLLGEGADGGGRRRLADGAEAEAGGAVAGRLPLVTGQQRAGVLQRERPQPGADGASRGAVHVRVPAPQRRSGAQQVGDHRALPVVGRQEAGPAQQQRMMRDQQLGAGGDGLAGDRERRVDGQQQAGYRRLPLPEDEACSVPVLRPGERIGGLEHADDVADGHAGLGGRRGPGAQGAHPRSARVSTSAAW